MNLGAIPVDTPKSDDNRIKSEKYIKNEGLIDRLCLTSFCRMIKQKTVRGDYYGRITDCES